MSIFLGGVILRHTKGIQRGTFPKAGESSHVSRHGPVSTGLRTPALSGIDHWWFGYVKNHLKKSPNWDTNWPTQLGVNYNWELKAIHSGRMIPSGNLLHSYGKSPLFMGKSTISMAIFHVAFCMFTQAGYSGASEILHQIGSSWKLLGGQAIPRHPIQNPSFEKWPLWVVTLW